MAIKEILGMQFKDETLEQAADSIIDDAQNNVKRPVYFVNAHCVNVAASYSVYAGILRSTPYVYADGIGMAIAARLWGERLINNVNGTDLFPVLCAHAARSGIPVAFFGAEPGVAEACAGRMADVYQGLDVPWVHHGYVADVDENDLIESLNASGAKILFVARGVPLQEHWIYENQNKLKLPVILGVGALFDFYSGNVRRAPAFLRRAKLEWLYRLYLEPRRLFRRYVIGNPEFLFRSVKMRITGNG